MNNAQQTMASKMNQYLKGHADLGNFSGSVLVAKEGKIVLSKGYGCANYECITANAPDSKFRIASITKQFTAVAILQLQEAGLLSVHDLLSKFIPDFPYGDQIRLHHLLSHTSGIPNISTFPDFATKSYFPITLEEEIEYIKGKPLNFTPGQRFAYSNSGYLILSYLIQLVTGKSYECYLQEYILNPLEMKNTGLDHQDTVLLKRASGYSKDDTGLKNAAYFDYSWASGSGGIYSTVEDLYRWNQALKNNSLISEQSKSEMMKMHVQIPSSSFLGYGYGIFVAEKPYQNISHEGIINGFCSMLLHYIDQDITIIILSNFSFSPLKKIIDSLTAITFDMPYEVPRKYSPQPVADDSILDKYAGTYKLTFGPELIIKKENHQLILYFGKQRLTLFLVSESEFIVNAFDAHVSFITENGEVTGLQTSLIFTQTMPGYGKKIS